MVHRERWPLHPKWSGRILVERPAPVDEIKENLCEPEPDKGVELIPKSQQESITAPTEVLESPKAATDAAIIEEPEQEDSQPRKIPWGDESPNAEWMDSYERKRFVFNGAFDGFHDLPAAVQSAFLKPASIPMSAHYQKKINGFLSKYKVSDSLHLTFSDVQYFAEFWMREGEKITAVPMDLFMAKTLPLMDFEIVLTDPNHKMDDQIYRFTVNERYTDAVFALENGYSTDAGPVAFIQCISSRCPEFYAFIPVGMSTTVDGLTQWKYVGWNIPKTIKAASARAELVAELTAVLECNFELILRMIYGVMLTMINPITKKLFTKPKTEVSRIYRVEPNTNKKSRRKLYVHAHYLKMQDVDDALDEAFKPFKIDGSTYTRRTMCWWVKGHFRNLASGDRTFVKGYWKGPWRDLQQNVDGGRDRKIIIHPKHSVKH